MHILITGASSGLGAGLAEKYASDGNHLYLIARRMDRLERVKTLCEAQGASVTLFAADVSDFARMQTIATELTKDSLDLIILNAGISTGHQAEVTPFEIAKKVYDTNLISLHALMEPLIPMLKEQQHGQVVFISSLASLLTMPTSLIYGSSKRAMNAYAEGLRFMLHPYNVHVTTIKPGFIITELTDKNDFAMPFLLSLKQGVNRIYNAIEKKKKIYAFPLRFVLIIKLLNTLPLFLRERIVAFKNFNKEV